MRTIVISIVAVVLVGAVVFGILREPETQNSEGTLTWYTFDEGLKIAAEQNKKILVDIYTDWCGWCKKMNREVYTDPKVSDIIAASFVPIKLNAESSRRLTYDEKQYTEEEFARAIGVTGYPTTVFLEANAEPITLVPGFMDAERFTSVLTYIGEDHFRSMSYEDFLQKTDRNR